MILASTRTELNPVEEIEAQSLIAQALFERARLTALNSPIGSLFFVWLEYENVGMSVALTWLVLTMIPETVTLLSTSYHLRHPPEPNRVQFFHLCQNVLHLLAGLTWGITIFLFQAGGTNSAFNDLLIILILGVVASSCIVNMAPSYRSFVFFSFGIIGPIIIHSFMISDDIHFKFAFGLMALLMIIWQFGWIAYRQFSNSIRQLVLNKALRVKLEHAMTIATEAQTDLEDRNHQLATALARVEQLATHDDLTGLFNRRYITGQLQHSFEMFERYGNPSSIIMMDLDFFKNINDLCGHSIGDQVLREVSNRLQSTTRSGDFCSRIGGEEFLMLLPMTHLEDARLLAERIRYALESAPCVRTPPLTITASFGVAELIENEEVDDWLLRADNALYSAKQTGRNRVIVS